MPDESIRKALDPRDFVLKRNGHGGTSPRRVRQMIASRTKAQKRSKAGIEAMLRKLERSDTMLLRLVDKLAA